MTYQPPPGQQPQQPYYPPPPPGYQQQYTTVSRTGLPVWVHVLYATLGWIPCLLGWVAWPIHAFVAQRKTVTHTRVG